MRVSAESNTEMKKYGFHDSYYTAPRLKVLENVFRYYKLNNTE